MPNRSKQKPPPTMADHGEPTPLEMETHLENASDAGHASKFVCPKIAFEVVANQTPTKDLSERVRPIQSPIADSLIITDVLVASTGKESTENPPLVKLYKPGTPWCHLRSDAHGFCHILRKVH